MLLTSSQVSFAISSVIVFFFTSALFLSGYVLQQQTVRDLRAAIKPQLVRLPSGPDFFPAPKLREDGFLVDTVVIEAEKRKQQDDDMVGATRWQKAARRKKMEEEEKKLKSQKPGLEEQDVKRSQGKTSKAKGDIPLSAAARRKQIKDQILADGNGENFKGYRRRMW